MAQQRLLELCEAVHDGRVEKDGEDGRQMWAPSFNATETRRSTQVC